MATLTVYAGKDINMNDASPFPEWQVQTAAATHWRLSAAEGNREDFYGSNITYTTDHQGLTGGTLTRIDFGFVDPISGYELACRMEGFNVSAAAVSGYMHANDVQGFLGLVFKGADTMNDSGKSDALNGYGGSDRLYGNGGADRLAGDQGNDTLTGGAGADKFVFDVKPTAANADAIADFSHAQGDKIVLDNDFFNVGAATTAGLGSQFVSGMNMATASVGANVHILYDTVMGVLYYDPTGGGSADRVQFETLQNFAALTATDFQVVN